jgi:hypothetical protein
MDVPALPCPGFIAALDPALCRAVDIYCERRDASLLAEPINAASNLAFFIAAWFAWRTYRASAAVRSDPLVAALIAMIAVIGAGSLTFHTIATRWAAWTDVIPILIFMLFYLWLALRRYCGWPGWLSALALALFFLATFNIELLVPVRFLRGGAMYLPALLTLAAMALAPVAPAVRRAIAGAALVFLVSYALRTADMPVCASIPVGTHFLWHCLNALLLYLLVRAALLHGAASRRATA